MRIEENNQSDIHTRTHTRSIFRIQPFDIYEINGDNELLTILLLK